MTQNKLRSLSKSLNAASVAAPTKGESKKYRCILIDPPTPQPMIGKFKGRHSISDKLHYKTMTIEQIKSLPVEEFAEEGCHLWLWTTNAFLKDSFDFMAAWNFKYLNIITWIKPSGLGAWFVNTTQHVLFGYYKKCQFNKVKYLPTHFNGIVKPGEHSKKPNSLLQLVEWISDEPRIEIFARKKRPRWDYIGDELGKPISIVSHKESM